MDDRYQPNAPPRRTKPARLSYALVTDDEARAIFYKIVTQHALAFMAYRAHRRLAGDTRAWYDVFQGWWIGKATLRFATSTDAVRFQHDVRDEVDVLINGENYN